MRQELGQLGQILRDADHAEHEGFLYAAAGIDGCWWETPAGLFWVDPYEEEPEVITVTGIDYRPVLLMSEVKQIVNNVHQQILEPGVDLLVAALRNYYVRDAFMRVTKSEEF